LEVVEQRKNACSTSTCVSLVLPGELPSIEEALKVFAVISGRSGTVLGILWVRFREKKIE